MADGKHNRQHEEEPERFAKSITHFLNFLKKRKGAVVWAFLPLEEFGTGNGLDAFAASIPDEQLWRHPQGRQGGRVDPARWHATLLLKMHEDPTGPVLAVDRLVAILHSFGYTAPLHSRERCDHKEEDAPREECDLSPSCSASKGESILEKEGDGGVFVDLMPLSISRPVSRLQKSFGVDVAATVAPLVSTEVRHIKAQWLSGMEAKYHATHDPYAKEGHISLTYTHGKDFKVTERLVDLYNQSHFGGERKKFLVPEIRIEATCGRYQKILRLRYGNEMR
jgi:hypothetical protein